MKKMLAMLLVLMLPMAACATVEPPMGPDAVFEALNGVQCTPAVVLCDQLDVLDARGDQGGKKTAAIEYTGETILVAESWDGYALVYHADGTQAGWVANECLMMDPAWYVCDQQMKVYAYPDVMAPRIGAAEAGTRLPILTEYLDTELMAGWVCVSLPGGAGWIRLTHADTRHETWFRPEMLAGITRAELVVGDASIALNGEEELAELSRLLINAEDRGPMTAGCPFTAELLLTLADDQQVRLQIATDSCCIYRVDGRDYAYARHLCGEDSSPDNDTLLRLFSTSAARINGWE